MTGIFELSAAIRDEMRGASWHDHPACPGFDALRLLVVRHRGFDGASYEGELIVSAALAAEVLAIFERIFAASFPIQSLRRIDHFAGSE